MIQRDPAGAAKHRHDLVIVGGGIYGACLALETARRGLRPLLLERGDFGGATSWNSLRIVHGGLRYLQRFDLPRFRESVRERRWFCRTFPELVRPQECVMPLYGEGLRRPAVLRAALALNDLLSWDRNLRVPRGGRIGGGRMLSAADTLERCPLADRRDLQGGAAWVDATLLSSQRVLIEILRWACSLGATALNYVEAAALVRRGAAIEGVQARDVFDGGSYTFSCAAVANCAGPWCGEVAARFDASSPDLFRPSLAFNVLLDIPPASQSMVAVAPRRAGRTEPVYFVGPAFGRLLAGTVHAAWDGPPDRPEPSDRDLDRFIAELNASLPGLGATRAHVMRVFAGLLPAARGGTARLAVRPVIRNHAREGGPQGLVSVSGVKFTTARRVAERTLTALGARFARAPAGGDPRPASPGGIDLIDDPGAGPFDPAAADAVRRLARDEAVMTVDDLVLRRTNWGLVGRDPDGLRRRVADALGWKVDGHDPDGHAVAAPNVQPHAQEEAASPGAAARAGRP